MDHVVYVDAKANEYEKLSSGDKTMIIRGATGRKLPHGRVFKGDVLYLINNNGEGLVKGKVIVEDVFNSEMMSSLESADLVKKHQTALNLSEKQYKKWAGKRYLVLITVKDFTEIEFFAIDKSNYGNMDDWLPVKDIKTVKLKLGGHHGNYT